MRTFIVDFVQYHTYTVDAPNEEVAEELAYKRFVSDMRSSVSFTHFDDMMIEEVERKE